MLKAEIHVTSHFAGESFGGFNIKEVIDDEDDSTVLLFGFPCNDYLGSENFMLLQHYQLGWT